MYDMFTRDIVQGFLGMSVPAINMMQWRELKEGEKLVSQSGDWEVLRRDSERGLNWQLSRTIGKRAKSFATMPGEFQILISTW